MGHFCPGLLLRLKDLKAAAGKPSGLSPSLKLSWNVLNLISVVIIRQDVLHAD